MRKKKKKDERKGEGFVGRVFLEAAEQYSIFFSHTKQKGGGGGGGGGLIQYKEEGKETSQKHIIIVKAHTPPGLPMASSSTRALLARFGKRGVSAIGRASSSSAETIRPFAASALGGIASDLAPVLGQDEDSVFLKWSAPETQNFAHRGILAQDECKVGWKSFEAKRSFPFPPLSLSLFTRGEGERRRNGSNTCNPIKTFCFYSSLFVSCKSSAKRSHSFSL